MILCQAVYQYLVPACKVFPGNIKALFGCAARCVIVDRYAGGGGWLLDQWVRLVARPGEWEGESVIWS